MKAIVNTAAGELSWLDRPTPDPGAGQVRIRSAAVGICATDLEMIAGWSRTPFGQTPGHEWAGVVDAVGDGGDRSLLRRRCVAENVLTDGGEVGFEHAGAYGEFFITDEANVRLLPDDFPMEQAALIEPLAVVTRGVMRLQPTTEGRTMVFGDGPIGLLTAAVLHARGVGPITMIGGRDERLAMAAAFGVTSTLNFQSVTADVLVAACRDAAGGEPVHVVEASGSPVGLTTAMHVAARGAKLLVLGDYGESHAAFLWNQLLHRELTLIGSNASADVWDEAVMLAIAGRVPLGQLVTHQLAVDAFAEGVRLTKESPDVIKVVLRWDGGADGK